MADRKKQGGETDVKMPSKQCRLCAEPIPATARKCKHCGAMQGAGRFFTFSASFLALILALFAVSGQTLAILRDAFHHPSAAIGFAVQDSTPHQLAVLVFNDGDRSGTVSRGLLTFADGRRLPLALGGNGDTQLVPPKSSLLVHYLVFGDLGAAPAMDAPCKLALLISDEHGLRSFDDQQIPCGVIAGLF